MTLAGRPFSIAAQTAPCFTPRAGSKHFAAAMATSQLFIPPRRRVKSSLTVLYFAKFGVGSVADVSSLSLFQIIANRSPTARALRKLWIG